MHNHVIRTLLSNKHTRCCPIDTMPLQDRMNFLVCLVLGYEYLRRIHFWNKPQMGPHIQTVSQLTEQSSRSQTVWQTGNGYFGTLRTYSEFVSDRNAEHSKPIFRTLE